MKLNNKDESAWNSVARFKELGVVLNDAELALRFGASMFSVRRWRKEYGIYLQKKEVPVMIDDRTPLYGASLTQSEKTHE